MNRHILNEIKRLVQEIHDDADHIVGTEAEDRAEVSLKDARAIKRLAKQTLEIIALN